MKNIFVGNLDFAATESSIRTLFEPYGSVDRVNLVTDRDTGRSKGFGFVEFANDDDAKAEVRRIAGLIPWVRVVDAGRLGNAHHLEQLTVLLLSINRLSRRSVGVRLTGL